MMAKYVANVHLPGTPQLTPGAVFEADGNDATIRGWRKAGYITRTDGDEGLDTGEAVKPADIPVEDSAPTKARRASP